MASEARKNAYVPYSGFSVGAALLARDGRVFTGCNIENVAFSPTVCAERTAFFKAVSEGATEFTKIAIISGRKGEPATAFASPCGVCRQVMLEFCDADSFELLLARSGNDYRSYKLSEIIPMGFTPMDLA